MPTPNLGITDLVASQANKVITINDALAALDEATQGVLNTRAAFVFDDGSTEDRPISTSDFQSRFLINLAPISGPENARNPGLVQLPSGIKRFFAVRNQDDLAATVRLGAAEGGPSVSVGAGEAVILYTDGAFLVSLGGGGAGDGGGGSFTPSQQNLYAAVKAILHPDDQDAVTADDQNNEIDIATSAGGGGSTGPSGLSRFINAQSIGNNSWTTLTLSETPGDDDLVILTWSNTNSKGTSAPIRWGDIPTSDSTGDPGSLNTYVAGYLVTSPPLANPVQNKISAAIIRKRTNGNYDVLVERDTTLTGYILRGGTGGGGAGLGSLLLAGTTDDWSSNTPTIIQKTVDDIDDFEYLTFTFSVSDADDTVYQTATFPVSAIAEDATPDGNQNTAAMRVEYAGGGGATISIGRDSAGTTLYFDPAFPNAVAKARIVAIWGNSASGSSEGGGGSFTPTKANLYDAVKEIFHPATNAGVTADDDNNELDVAAGGGAATFQGCYLRKASATTNNPAGNIPSTFQWDAGSVQYEDGEWWAASTPARLTVPAGVTKVRLTAGAYGPNDYNEGLYIYRYDADGSNRSLVARQDGAEERNSVVTPVIAATEGQYFTADVWNDSSAATVDDAYFSIEKVA